MRAAVGDGVTSQPVPVTCHQAGGEMARPLMSLEVTGNALMRLSNLGVTL
jgi:hypothetical protein